MLHSFSIALLLLVGFSTAAPSGNNCYQRNYKTIQALYSYTNYPLNKAVTANPKLLKKGILANNVVGRINPVGNFSGLDHSLEYFYALAPSPDLTPAHAAINGAAITQFDSACPSVAAATIKMPLVVFQNQTATRQVVSFLVQKGFFHFNKKGEIDAYDLVIQNLDESLQGVGIYSSNPQVQTATIQQICGAQAQFCSAPSLQQYTSIPDCIAQLSAKPYGTYDNVWSDTVVCRSVHVELAAIDPTVHCAHVGPSGGGKCINQSLFQKYGSELSRKTPFTC